MNELFTRYATGFIDYLIEDDKDSIKLIKNDIQLLIEIFNNDETFADFLSANTIKFEEKIDFINTNLSFLNLSTKNFLNLIIKKNRSFFIKEILIESLKMIDAYLEIETGIIYSPFEMDEKEIKKIKDAIEKKRKHQIKLINKIDNSLIGGFKIVLKNDIYDYSIKTKLENLKKALILEEN